MELKPAVISLPVSSINRLHSYHLDDDSFLHSFYVFRQKHRNESLMKTDEI